MVMKDLKNFTTFKNHESIINYFSEDSIENINKYLKRGNLVDLVTKYELYYHISLSSYVFETLLDLQETVKKVQELNLLISPQKALFDIYNLILQNINKEVLHKDLEEKIRKVAALQALDDFIKADKELIGSKYYELQKKEQINNDKFFSENMKYNFESNYQKTFEHYNLVITDKLVQDVKNRILNP